MKQGMSVKVSELHSTRPTLETCAMPPDEFYSRGVSKILGTLKPGVNFQPSKTPRTSTS